MKILTLLILFLTVLILPAILSFGIRYIPARSQPSLDKTEKIYSQNSISQSFLGKENNLTAIGLSIKNPNLINKQDILLSIYDENGILLKTSILNGSHIPDGDFVKFVFSPIVDSKNKKVTFTLSAANVDEVESLQLYYTTSGMEGEFKIKDKIASGSASFVDFYKPTTRLALITNIYTSWFGRLLSDAGFFVLYILLILGLSGYLFYSNSKD